jgi:transcriptional regulator with XRE-family HTH domain
MINEALRLLRRFKGLSQTQMAQELGVTKSWISEIEASKKEPTLNLLQVYAEVLDVPLSSILFFSEQISNNKPSEKTRTFVSKKILAIMDYIDAHSGEDPDVEDASPNTSDKTIAPAQAG